MKKTLLFVAAAVTALFSACSSDELVNGNDVVNVSFNASFDQVMPTRGVSGESDGTAATKLYVAVYNKDNQLIKAISKIGVDGSEGTVTVSGKAATVNFQLVKGQTYNFVFWAQNPNATAGAVVFNPETGKVSVDYTQIKANDESLDAFTAHVNNLTVTGTIAQDVTLKRPWAQVNYGSAQADWDAAGDAGITVAKSKVTVNNVYTTLNALTGEVVGEATPTDVVLAANTIPASATPARTLTVSGTEYKYIGLNYLLVGNEGQQSLIKADLEIQKADGTVINTLAFSNVPVQRNYRTNIVGNLLTSQTQFNITLDEMYEDESTVSVWEGGIEKPETAEAVDNNIYITSAEELAWVSQQVASGNTFAGKTLKMTKNIDLNNKAWTPIGSNADDAAHNFQGIFDGQNFTISNLNVDLTATPAYRSAGLFGAVSGSAVLKNFTVANATVKNITSGSATDNGTAVVAGSFTYSGGGTIENVSVKNSTVEGNRYVGGVAGYFGGTVKNCTVDGLIMTAKPDNLTGSYDNGDKVGGVVGYANSTTNTITNNTIKNFTITAYRDFGGILGCGNLTSTTVSSNTVTDGTLIIDQITNSYGAKTANANAVVGRVLGGSVDASNASSNVSIGEKIANGIMYSVNDKTYTLAAGANIATAINSGKSKGLTEFTLDLAAGSYNMVSPTTGSAVTIKFNGQGESTELHMENLELNASFCTLEFNDVKLMCNNKSEYKGIQHGTKETYNNCYFTGVRHLYATTTEFNNCHFTQDYYQYCVFVYGTNDCTFNNCTFNSVGKTAKVYKENESVAKKVTFSGCTFTTTAEAAQAAMTAAGKSGDWKTAIEIDGQTIDWTININNCTETGHAHGEKVTTSTLYNVDANANSNTKVYIDGVQQAQVWKQ